MNTHRNKSSLAARAACRGLLGLTVACAGAVSAGADQCTEVKSYAVPVSTDYAVQTLLSAGDQIPNTSNPLATYQMVGIPDGLGATEGHDGTTVLFMNHELGNTVLSEPNLGGPLNRGAFVSRLILGKDGCVLSGQRAYDKVFDEETGAVLPAAEVGNATFGFGRFCSAGLAYKEAGFDRPIYFTNEESGPGQVYDFKGALAWTIFDKEIHSLVKMGRFAWENAPVRPDKGELTVVMGMEDGPATLDNQLYMYVGKKSKAKGASVLSRNGLDTGKLYVFVSDTAGKTNEGNFTAGSIEGHWEVLPDQTSVDAATLETQSDAVGAFAFIRIEDGAFDKKDSNKFYFVTTGSGGPNQLGRAYAVEFDKKNILGKTKLSVIFNGDTVAAAGEDTAFAPDNVGTSEEYVMICEDGTTQSRVEYAKRAREGSIWRYDLNNGFAAKRVVELNPNGMANNPPANPPVVGPGVWETSGIIDSSAHFGKDSWLFVVQAHSPSVAPAPNTVEDGQLLLMVPTKVKIGQD